MEGKEKTNSDANMQMYIASLANENKALKAKLEEAGEAIATLQTQNLFSYINFCMKVMEHPEMYSESFVMQMSKDTETLMTRFHDVMVKPNIKDNGTDRDSEEA